MRGGKAGDVGLAGHVFSSCDSLRSCLTIDLWTFLPYSTDEHRERESWLSPMENHLTCVSYTQRLNAPTHDKSTHKFLLWHVVGFGQCKWWSIAISLYSDSRASIYYFAQLFRLAGLPLNARVFFSIDVFPEKGAQIPFN